MLLEYLVPSRARREVWKALRAPGAALTVHALAKGAQVPYSNAHREVLRMRDVGLLCTQRVGRALVCTWNLRNPAARRLTAFLEASERDRTDRPRDDRVTGSLKAWGAGLARDTASVKPLDLEETLAYGVDLARRDPDAAQAWPVVFANNLSRVDLRRLETLVRRLAQKRAFGFLVSLAGKFLGDSRLTAFASRFRDSRVREDQDFFTFSKGKRMNALTKANTPALAKEWHFRMNTSLEGFRSHFDKFVSKE